MMVRKDNVVVVISPWKDNGPFNEHMHLIKTTSIKF